MSIDAVSLDVPDTPANTEFFGRTASGHGASPSPKVQAVALAECGTHAITAVETGGANDAEQPLARARREAGEHRARHAGDGRPRHLQLRPGPRDHRRRRRLRPAGQRAARPARPGVAARRLLPSYIPEPKAKKANYKRLLAGTVQVTELPGMRVRVVDYDVPGRGGGEVITVITSVLDHQDLPAPEIAAAYDDRWEIEITFDEIETHQRGPATLRSRSPDMVLQELYGLLITHYAIRKLMAEAADQAGIDPDRLSFTRALNIVRRQVTAQAAFSPLTPRRSDR